MSKTSRSKAFLKPSKKERAAAAKAPLWLRTGAAALFDPHGEKAYRDSRMGTFGPASEVRRIDPATGEVAQ